MQAVKVNGTSHLRTNYARDYGFAEKCTDSKLYFPARHLCSFLRQSVLLSPPSRSYNFQKILNAEGKSLCRDTAVSSPQMSSMPWDNHLLHSGVLLKTSKAQRHQQLHNHSLRLSRPTRIASKQFIFCKMKQFLLKEVNPEQIFFSFPLIVLLDFSPI